MSRKLLRFLFGRLRETSWLGEPLIRLRSRVRRSRPYAGVALRPDWFDANLPFPFEIHAPTIENDLANPLTFKVYVDSWEPSPYCESPRDVRRLASRLDLILTKNEDLLDLPNARFLAGLNSWVHPWLPTSKHFSVSFLCTAKKRRRGYAIRHQVWRSQSRITGIPLRFWSSRRSPIDPQRMIPASPPGLNDKIALFESMFSICPENTSERNYFTEKIIDCLVTRTVPVYWGCVNIGDFFDERGIIRFEGLDDLVTKLNALTPESYERMRDAVEANYHAALKYADPPVGGRLERIILEYIAATSWSRPASAR